MPTNFGFVIGRELAGMERPGSYGKLRDDMEFLKMNDIHAIVSLTETPLEKAFVEEFGFKYLHLPIPDFTPPSGEQIEKFLRFYNQMEAEGHGTLVHCGAGMGRTGTMLACALVEKGMGAEPQATFSTCFGAPFMPRHPTEYGNRLKKLIADHKVDCWLVNTGWTGGAYGEGARMPIRATRALLAAALDGSLKAAPMRKDAIFGFDVPAKVAGVDDRILNPRETWREPSHYDAQAQKLAAMFVANFAKFERYVSAAVRAAAPKA